jgi:hypothetical protein
MFWFNRSVYNLKVDSIQYTGTFSAEIQKPPDVYFYSVFLSLFYFIKIQIFMYVYYEHLHLEILAFSICVRFSYCHQP